MEVRKLDYLLNDSSLSFDFINLVCGEFIGEGAYRDVYEYNINKNFVVKVERDENTNANVLEYEIWNRIKLTDTKKWFAEIINISKNKRIIIQRKTKPLKSYDIPEKIPAFFGDVKEENFGWIKKQLVVYQSVLFKLIFPTSKQIFHPKMKNFKKCLKTNYTEV